jgi:hypothetical protein
VPPSLFVLDLGPCTGIFGRGLRSPLNPLSATPRALPSPAFILLCDGRFQSPDVCNQGIFSFPCFSAQSCFFFEVFLGAGDFLGPVDHKSSVAAAVRWDFPCEGAATVSCSWICLRPALCLTCRSGFPASVIFSRLSSPVQNLLRLQFQWAPAGPSGTQSSRQERAPDPSPSVQDRQACLTNASMFLVLRF